MAIKSNTGSTVMMEQIKKITPILQSDQAVDSMLNKLKLERLDEI